MTTKTPCVHAAPTVNPGHARSRCDAPLAFEAERDSRTSGLVQCGSRVNLLPVLERELRSQARRRGTYGARLAGAALLIGLFGLVTGARRDFPVAMLGPILFILSNGAVYCLIWLGVPLMVADAISREKREGTLGLLFLTPLTAWDIVLGKALTLGWGGVGLLLAGLPVLVLPFAMGGVSWVDAVVMLAIHALSLLLALTAGLTASALSRHPARAVTAALLLSGVLSVLLNLGLLLFFGQDLETAWFGPAVLAQLLTMARFPTRLTAEWMGAATVLVVALAVAAILLTHAVRQIRDFWQEAPVTTDRLRRALSSWVRWLGGLGTVLLLIGWGRMWLETPQRALPVGLAVMNLLIFVCLWVGIIAQVLQDSMEAGPAGLRDGRAGPDRHASGGGAPAGPRRLGLLAALAVVPATLVSAGVSGTATWPAVLATLLNHLGTALLAFGVAHLAWAWGRTWIRAALRALILAVPVLLVWMTIEGLVLGHVLAESGLASSAADPWRHGWGGLMLAGGVLGTGAFLLGGAEALRELGAGVLFIDTLGVVMGSAGASLGLWAVAGWIQTRQSRGPGPDDPGANLARDFLEPLFARGWLGRRKRQVLEQNPMRWVFERRGVVRLQRLGWLAAVAVAESIVVTDGRRLVSDELLPSQIGILSGLMLGLSFAAVLSFQEERRSGAMELILVTPLTPWQIVAGRWRGLVGQFLPAFGLVLLACGWLPLGFPPHTPAPIAIWLLAGGTVITVAGAVSTVGMLCALRLRTAATGWLLTALVPVGNLVALWWLLPWVRRWSAYGGSPVVLAGLCAANLALTGVGLRALISTLRRRVLRG